LRDSVGKYIPESLPNIKGEYTKTNIAANALLNATINEISVSGALSTSSNATTGWFNSGGTAAGMVMGLSFDASNSSSTYKDGAPVQERTIQMYLEFYLN
jgi:hypothetical protein